MVIFKDNVRFRVWTPALSYMLDVVQTIDEKKYDWKPLNLVVTSVNDSNHSVNSRHYKNEAIDIRTRSFKDEIDKSKFVFKLQEMLGNKFTVLYEDPGGPNQHIHIQVRKGELFP